MGQYYEMLKNRATIQYPIVCPDNSMNILESDPNSSNCTEEVVTNEVCILVYKFSMEIYGDYCVKYKKCCNCDYKVFCNKFILCNDNPICLQDVYIRTKIPNYMNYVKNSLYINDKKGDFELFPKETIYIGRVLPMSKTIVNFTTIDRYRANERKFLANIKVRYSFLDFNDEEICGIKGYSLFKKQENLFL